MTQSDLEATFLHWLVLLMPEVPRPAQQFRFHPTRRWAFDFAWPASMLAVEIDGGQWAPHGGRHNTDGDRDKLNNAAVLGWRVLRFSGSMLKRDPAGVVQMVKEAL